MVDKELETNNQTLKCPPNLELCHNIEAAKCKDSMEGFTTFDRISDIQVQSPLEGLNSQINGIDRNQNQIKTADLLINQNQSKRKWSISSSQLAHGWGWAASPTKRWSYYLSEIFAGLIVAITQIPMAISFGLISNAPMVSALNGCWITCLLTALLGGSPGSITDITATTAATVRGFLEENCSNGVCNFVNLQYLFPSIIVSGVITATFGFFKFAKFIKFLPSSVMIGVCNSIALISIKSQIEIFRNEWKLITGAQLIVIIVIISSGIVISELWSIIPKVGKIIPGYVVSLIVSIIMEFYILRHFFHIKTKLIGDYTRIPENQIFPIPFWINPNFQYNMKLFTFQNGNIWTIIQLGFSLFTVMAICGLITSQIVDGNGNQQLIGVGIANIISGLLGGMAGTTGSFRTKVNKNCGGTGRESGIFASIFFLLIITHLSFALNYIPIAGLSGLIFLSAIKSFKWWSLELVITSFLPKIIRNQFSFLKKKISSLDALIIASTTIIAVLSDLGVAILTGLFLTVCGFAWSSLCQFEVCSSYEEATDTKFYSLSGPLFFATKKKFVKAFDIQNDPKQVVLFLKNESSSFDYSATETLQEVWEKYKSVGKTFVIKGMNYDGIKIAKKDNCFLEYLEFDTVEQNLEPIPPAKYTEPVFGSKLD